MSKNMGRKNQPYDRREIVIGRESVGHVFSQVCPACGLRHGNKSSPKCSRIKQKMYREGKL